MNLLINNKRSIINSIIACCFLAGFSSCQLSAMQLAIAARWLGYAITKPDTTEPTIEEMNIVTYRPTGDDYKYNPKLVNPTDTRLRNLNNRSVDSVDLSINDKKYRVSRGIHGSLRDCQDPIFIYCGGYSNDARPYSYCAYLALKATLMQGPCIVFENPNNTRRRFNFCQEQDLLCLTKVVQQLLDINPDACIVLMGPCQGGTNMLRWLAALQKNGDKQGYLKSIAAVVIESPTISVKHAQAPYPAAHLLCRLFLPNYNPHASIIMDDKVFPDLPIFIGSLPEDGISALDDIKELVKHMNSGGCRHVTHFVSDGKYCNPVTHVVEDIRHGKIGKAKDYQKALQQFYNDNQLFN